MERNCGNCTFYSNYECRRFPPQPVPFVVDNQTWQTEIGWVYPCVQETTPICGEWRRK